MHWTTKIFALSLLIPAARAQGNDVMLTADPTTQSLQLQSMVPGVAYIAVGQPADPPLSILGISLDVVPEIIVSVGAVESGDVRRMFVPRGLSHLSAEAVVVDPKLGRLADSHPVLLRDAFADIVTATFRAELITTDSIPPHYTVGASLTAPTAGHEFVVDSFERVKDRTNVYLRLIEPGVNELLPLALTEYRTSVTIGVHPGDAVDVYLMRAVRGGIVPEVYVLMASLPTDAK